MTKRMLTTGDVGRYCGVHFRTVSRWIAQGRLKGHRLPGGRGDYRVQTADFLDFLHENGLPVPAEFAAPARRVLIVEQEPQLARALDGALSEAGFETQIATNGLQAGVLLHSYCPSVMTLELDTPGTGGVGGLHFLRTVLPLSETKILVTSSHPCADLEEVIEIGAEVLQKPFGTPELVARVCSLVGSGLGDEQMGGAHERARSAHRR